jgi:hypothetical protein
MQLSIFDAIKARDEALAQVSANADTWIESALARIPTLTGELTGEDIRFALIALVGEPHHSNAWGALIKTAKGRGLIQNTGQYVPMRAANSHARMTSVYKIAARLVTA